MAKVKCKACGVENELTSWKCKACSTPLFTKNQKIAQVIFLLGLGLLGIMWRESKEPPKKPIVEQTTYISTRQKSNPAILKKWEEFIGTMQKTGMVTKIQVSESGNCEVQVSRAFYLLTADQKRVLAASMFNYYSAKSENIVACFFKDQYTDKEVARTTEYGTELSI